jgi:hypothetical protein
MFFCQTAAEALPEGGEIAIERFPEQRALPVGKPKRVLRRKKCGSHFGREALNVVIPNVAPCADRLTDGAHPRKSVHYYASLGGTDDVCYGGREAPLRPHVRQR